MNPYKSPESEELTVRPIVGAHNCRACMLIAWTTIVACAWSIGYMFFEYTRTGDLFSAVFLSSCLGGPMLVQVKFLLDYYTNGVANDAQVDRRNSDGVN